MIFQASNVFYIGIYSHMKIFFLEFTKAGLSAYFTTLFPKTPHQLSQDEIIDETILHNALFHLTISKTN
jgi:hypothetical protein